MARNVIESADISPRLSLELHQLEPGRGAVVWRDNVSLQYVSARAEDATRHGDGWDVGGLNQHGLAFVVGRGIPMDYAKLEYVRIARIAFDENMDKPRPR